MIILAAADFKVPYQFWIYTSVIVFIAIALIVISWVIKPKQLNAVKEFSHTEPDDEDDDEEELDSIEIIAELSKINPEDDEETQWENAEE